MKNIGGWHPGKSIHNTYDQQFPAGSIFAIEGQRLYDLIIEKKPLLVVEVGANFGCSTTWIATALKENGKGKLISYDIDPKSWSMFPDELSEWVEKRVEDALTCKVPKNIDLLFEDGSHLPGFTKAILQRFKADIVISHDYCHWSCPCVADEFKEVVGEPTEIFFKSPSDCGLAIKIK